jgi:hypothetical protein
MRSSYEQQREQGWENSEHMALDRANSEESERSILRAGENSSIAKAMPLTT